MGWLRAIPLLLFPAILYGAVAMTMDHGAVRASLDQIFLSITLPSGADFTVTRGHALTMLAAGLLFIEVIKSTSTPAPPRHRWSRMASRSSSSSWRSFSFC